MKTKALSLMLLAIALTEPAQLLAQQGQGSGRESKEPGKQETYLLHPIGCVKKAEGKTTIVLDKKYQPGLLRLDTFSHVYVLWWFDKNDTPEKRAILQVQPRKDPKNPLSGVFATRAPFRPNPIALTLCKIVAVRDNVVEIDDIDAFDETPVLDLKPYNPHRESIPSAKVPDWLTADTPSGPVPELEIRILFDNTAANKDYLRSWGFSALIDFRGKRILFDSGGDPILLLEHMDKMKIDPKSIDEAFISHHHDDHRRGIYWVFEKNPKMKVHFLDTFGVEAFKAADQVKMKPNRVKEAFELMPGVYSTGPIDGLPPEQALLLETSQGLVMLVGCSHPGIVKMVEAAQKQRNKDSIRMLVGGFHLLKSEPEDIRKVVQRLDELKVKVVVPAHCTGDLATEMLQSTFGKHTAGAGRWIIMDGKRLEFRTVPLK